MRIRTHETSSHIALLIRNLPPYARPEVGMHIAIDTAVLQNDEIMLIASVPSIERENLLLFARYVHLHQAPGTMPSIVRVVEILRLTNFYKMAPGTWSIKFSRSDISSSIYIYPPNKLSNTLTPKFSIWNSLPLPSSELVFLAQQ